MAEFKAVDGGIVAPHLVDALTLSVWGPEVYGHRAVPQRVWLVELRERKTNGRSVPVALRWAVAPPFAGTHGIPGATGTQ